MVLSTKLLLVAGVLIATLIGLSALNERTLPLFNGDRDLAAQTMKTVFALFGGLSLALAQPFFWQRLSSGIQSRVRDGGSEGAFAQWVLRPEFRDFGASLGWFALGAFSVVAVVFAVLLWTGRG